MQQQRQRIGLIGLGSMGRGIGQNLMKHGFPLTVYDANPDAIEALPGFGATAVETPRAVAERSDVVITVLPDGPDVEATALGPEGIAAGARPGTILVDCSTIAPAVSRAIGARLAERGVRMVDAAMGRSSGEAEAGTLLFMVGAEPEDFRVIEPVLAALGSDVFQALAYWLKLGFISFGGPAGQIAIMHQELVEKRRWISERRFLHALNYCMLLPGPEAQQLATYIGWLMHRTWGGIVAGALFVLPSLFILIGLSWVYMAYGDVPAVAGVFYGIKPAVTAIVLHAALAHRLARAEERLAVGDRGGRLRRHLRARACRFR